MVRRFAPSGFFAAIFAALALVVPWQAHAVEVPTYQEHLDLEARVEALELLHAPPPPPDNPPSVANLSASCDEDMLCSGNIGAADDSGSFTVTWGAGPAAFTGQSDGSWSWQTVDGDGLAVYDISGTVSDAVNPDVPFTLQVTGNDTVTPPPPPPVSNLQLILDMPAGSWLAYGDPWSDLETSGAIQRVRDNCGRTVASLSGAWNGVVWDGRYLWMFAPGGHGDACFNGVIRYDLEAAQPELVVPHLALNMPVMFTHSDGAGGWNMPYASATPWPACVGQGDNCEGLSEAERLLNGPNYPGADYRAHEALGSETHGAFLRPRSSHTRQNTVKIGDYIYLFTAHTYEDIKEANQVWRFNVNDPANTIERMPDRVVNGAVIGGPNLNFVQPPGMGTLMLYEAKVCEVDPAAGTYNCTNFPTHLSVNAVAMWDDERGGIWVYDPNKEALSFVYNDAGTWVKDAALSVTDATMFDGTGIAGICIVPTSAGTNPVLWGAGSRLIRWDGTALSEVAGQTDQPGGHNHMQNKWAWNADLGVCLGTWNWTEGVWAWRPDFSNWQEASLPPPDPDPDPQPGDWPTFAGHTVAPVPVTLAAWDEPVQLQPEAPDVAALCPGPWAELHYASEEDLEGSRLEVKALADAGTGNVRIYLHPTPDGTPYVNSMDVSKGACAEIIGVPPESGARPRMLGGIAPGSIGIIVRGVDTDGGTVGWSQTVATNTYIRFIIIHDSSVTRSLRSPYGVSDPNAPLTYMEFVNSSFGPDTGWHVLYLERSIGDLVALGNVFYGSGSAGHALKNLAHQSRLEGNVFSNVGLDGQALATANNGSEIVGLFALDSYACTETVIRNNTFVFRTSGNVRTVLSYRGRRAWGNCDKGQRLPDGRWEWLSAESEEYQDPAVWDEVESALPAFAEGFAAARAEPWLFTHLVDGNTFIVFNAHGGADDTRAAEIHSLRPVARNPLRNALIAEAQALSSSCSGKTDRHACFVAGAGDTLRYAYERVAPASQNDMVNAGKLPRGVPIPAPADWTERAGIFWGEQAYITCDAEGLDCAVTGDRVLSASPLLWDDVQLASPPRVIEE
jgi:hypothetical protein